MVLRTGATVKCVDRVKVCTCTDPRASLFPSLMSLSVWVCVRAWRLSLEIYWNHRKWQFIPWTHFQPHANDGLQIERWKRKLVECVSDISDVNQTFFIHWNFGPSTAHDRRTWAIDQWGGTCFSKRINAHNDKYTVAVIWQIKCHHVTWCHVSWWIQWIKRDCVFW